MDVVRAVGEAAGEETQIVRQPERIRNADDESSGRLQEAMQIVEGPPRSIHMLEDIPGNDHVERGTRNAVDLLYIAGHAGKIGAHCAEPLDRSFIDVDTGERARDLLDTQVQRLGEPVDLLLGPRAHFADEAEIEDVPPRTESKNIFVAIDVSARADSAAPARLRSRWRFRWVNAQSYGRLRPSGAGSRARLFNEGPV